MRRDFAAATPSPTPSPTHAVSPPASGATLANGTPTPQRPGPLETYAAIAAELAWEPVTSPADGRIYWWNRSTGKTAWELPFASADGNDHASPMATQRLARQFVREVSA